MIICGFKCFLLASSLCLMAQTLLAGNLDIKNGKYMVEKGKKLVCSDEHCGYVCDLPKEEEVTKNKE